MKGLIAHNQSWSHLDPVCRIIWIRPEEEPREALTALSRRRPLTLHFLLKMKTIARPNTV
jgi:hypothetical protein